MGEGVGWIETFTGEGGGVFYCVKGTWGGVTLAISPFSKLKTSFRECWTSIKIKIKKTCVSKEYKIKIKIEKEQWLQLKILFLLGYNLKTVVLWGGGVDFWWEEGGNTNLVEGESFGRARFSRWERVNEQIFGLWWGLSPPPPLPHAPIRENPDC